MLRSALASLARNVNSTTVRTYATQPIQPPTRLINLASLADNAGAVKQVTQLFIIYGISTCVKLIRPLQKKNSVTVLVEVQGLAAARQLAEVTKVKMLVQATASPHQASKVVKRP